MYTNIKFSHFILVLFIGAILTFGIGCSQKEEPLVVYAGKGLKFAMEEVRHTFEQKKGIPVSITYAGSNSLLTTLKNTKKGDVFIPGSASYIKKAGKLATTAHFLAHHIPVFIVRANDSKALKSYSDLLVPGIQIAIGDKGTCAIGKVGEAILNDVDPKQSFRSNIVVTGSTVNELLNLVVDGDVDAALVWGDMLNWDKAKALKYIVIPEEINKPKEIKVTVLSTSTSPERAALFAEFVASEGQDIFIKHGFNIK